MEITDICNMALAYLGKAPIASIDEKSESARQCKRFYNHAKQQLLRTYYFNFSKRLVALAELEFNHPKWEHVYAYPSKCLFIRKLFNETDEAKPLTPYMKVPQEREHFEVFLVNGNVKAIGTNIEEAYCEYSYDVDDENMYTQDFVEALARMLAYYICIPLTGDNNVAAFQMQTADRALMQAKYTTAMEQGDSLEYPTSYADARG